MTEFIDTRSWPLVRMHMPTHVADEHADEFVAAFAAVFARKSPFVLRMDGAEMPQDSRAFMKAYAQWRDASYDAQRRYCLGAFRIEPDEALRRQYRAHAEAWEKSGQAPYAYRIFANELEAQAQVRQWLTKADQSPGRLLAS